MTAIAHRNSFRRAFACWPSRIGAMALLALALSLGSEAFAGQSGDVPPQAASATAAS